MTKYKQCQAKTKSGKTCRRNALPDAEFCFQHNIVEQKPPSVKRTDKPPVKSPQIKTRPDNGRVPPEPGSFQAPEVFWDLIKAGAIVVATYVSYRIIRAITRR